MGEQSRVASVGIELHVVPVSAPCAAVERGLELKGLAFERAAPAALRVALRLVRLGMRSVPAMLIDDRERVVGARAILRRLDELAPEPVLFPPGGEARALVARAEEWADEVLQPLAKRMLWASIRRDPAALPPYVAGSGLRLPALAVRAVAPAVARVEAAIDDADEGTIRADLRALPGHLDRVDGWIARGVLGGEPPNAADLQIAATTRLLATIGDLAPFLDGRPAQAHARVVFEPQHGATGPGLLPADWLAGSWRERREQSSAAAGQ
jgi:glutathione S-transferase